MMSVRLPTIAHALPIVLLASVAAFGQDVGDTVRARQAVDLKVENQAVAAAAAGDLLTVRKLNDNWLWVQTAQGKRGWVLKEHVEVVTRAGAPAPLPAPGGEGSPPIPGEDPWLRAIGVLSGQNIRTTYVYIAAVAEGFGKGTYDAQHVQQLMAEVVGMAKLSQESLEKVSATNIVEADRAAIERVIGIQGLLSQEAAALSQYVQTKSDRDLQAFEQARDAVWPKVKGMLELK
jgi:hypothetical protein